MKNILTKTMKTLAVAGMTMGLAFGAKADTVACTNCLTFSATEDFGIRMIKYLGGKSGKITYPAAPDVSLEYSTDQVNWQTFKPDTDYAAGADHKLYLRGKNNATFASARYKYSANIFTNAANSAATAIACSGNIETLLDYTKVAAGEHPTMVTNAFCCLFRFFHALTTAPVLPATTLTDGCYNMMFNGCTSLTAAPALPATTLQPYCYYQMFTGCESLTAAPVLPAMTLTDHCYYQMFQGCLSLTAAPALPAKTMTDDNCYSSMFLGCTSLTDLPDLPATTLAKQCYAGMFNSCPALVVNTNAPGKAWWIPAEAATSAATAERWSQLMFKFSSGNITQATDAPVPGTTYYVASAPVEFRVTEPEHATFQAHTNGAPVSVPFTGDYLTDFAVTYTAVEGKMFPGGYKTLTTNVTASAATVMVTLAAEQQPVDAVACTNCLTFSAAEAFGIRMNRGQGKGEKQPAALDVNLEYSTDQIYWQTFNADTDYAAGDDHKLYLRGKNNKTFASGSGKASCNIFTNTADSVATAIACSGNIETLLDYTTVEAGEHPPTDTCTFDCLFLRFAALTTAPELPATNLQTCCYCGMFQGCSLTVAPKLPATTMKMQCYNSMFSGCTSLTTAPELPATNLAMMCYCQMFQDCTSLVVNTNAPGKAWSIPAEASSTASASSWNLNMFKGTPGDITNATVTCGTPYYVASAPVTLDVTEVDNATFQTYANDAPVDVPCTINYIMPVKVVYTAAPGYAFPDGKTEFTTNVTASAETVTVTLTDDQKPVPLPPVEIEVKAPEGATAAVYSNEVAAANLVPVGGTVLSNSIAYVVYTVSEAGKFFENGATAVTNTLDTTTNPATDKSAYVPTAAGKPKVQLGIVAQRYPWDGTLDVQYWAQYTPNEGYEIEVTVTLPDGTEASETYDCKNGKNTVEFDARKKFGEVQVKGVKVKVTLIAPAGI